MIREHEVAEFIPYQYNLKGYQASNQKIRRLAFKKAEILIKMEFLRTLCYHKVYPPHPWTCPLHTILPNFQPLPPLLNTPPLFGIGTNHSKRQKTGP